jgi:predicted extracellular nuclease
MRRVIARSGVLAVAAAGVVVTGGVLAPFSQAAGSAQPACEAADTSVGAVQGSGETSPVAGTTVTVQGTVVGDYEGAAPHLRGFYLQDGGDGDPATSDGLFVFDNIGGTSPDLVSDGQVVQVTGQVTEFQGQTQISATTIEQCGGTGTVRPVDVRLPVAGPTALERYEGMLVRFRQTLSVTETSQLGRFGQVVVSSGGRLYQPTALYPPGDPRAVALQQSNANNQLIIDDDQNGQNPDPIVFGRGGKPLGAANTLRAGDTVTGPAGVLTYTWAGNAASGNAYRLRPVGALGGRARFAPANPRPTRLPAVGGPMKVASANLLNFFDTFGAGACTLGVGSAATDCRGASNPAEYNRQLAKEVAELTSLDADVVGVMELENDGYGTGSAIQALVAALNAADGPGSWAFVDPDAATGGTNVAGTDAIKAVLLYRPGRVTPVPGKTFVDPAAVFERHPVAQTFRARGGGVLTVVANHFKSKGSCPPAGDPNADAGDGAGCWNAKRTEQAGELARWLKDTVVPAAGDPDVLIVGDLNSYARETPIRTLEAAGYLNLARAYGGNAAYSYGFDAQWGYLDYSLASTTLRPQASGAGDVHINADEPSVLDYNTEFKSPGQVGSLYAPDRYRTSDHDPVLTGLRLRR